MTLTVTRAAQAAVSLLILGVAVAAASPAFCASTGSLNGSFYSLPNSVDNETLAQAFDSISGMAPTGTFLSTGGVLTGNIPTTVTSDQGPRVGYFGYDNSTISETLSGDGAGYNGPDDDVGTSVMTFTGYIDGSGTQTMSLYSNDGAAIIIDGTTVVSQTPPMSADTLTGNYTFASSGYVPIEIVLYNNSYYNASKHFYGASSLSVGLADDPLSTPEPASTAGIGIGVLGIGALLLPARKRVKRMA